MKSTHDRNGLNPTSQRETAPPRKRFRIEKLEERIAPKKGGKGTHNCGGGSSASSGSFSGSIY